MGVSQRSVQSALQREVQEVIRELHESSVHLLAIGNKLRDVASGYEKLLSDLHGRSSNDPSKAGCESIRAQPSDIQSSEDTKRR